jgi:transposase-like protein
MKLDITRPIYNDEDAARAHLEAQLWPNGPVCPHCGSLKATKLEGKAHRKGLYQCNEPECREQFSVTVNTVFERSKIPLHKWVLASHLMAASKKGMSSKQLQRMLGVTYKTAWFMSMRLREAMDAKDYGPIGGDERIVEADETFIGGRARNIKKGKPLSKKKPVVALVERHGEMRAKAVPDVTGKTVRDVVVGNASTDSYLMTDDASIYVGIGEEFYGHSVSNHSKREYVRAGGFVHSNTVESFFAVLKRGITGSFHSVSEKHLQRYVDEFAFRWNTRSKLGIEDFERAERILKGAAGKRLTYRRTDEAKEREGDGA